ncbi:MAG: hypothetical protein GM45_5095 [actinobacterium acAMD-5]|jgi:hypothetical protein|nr:MAG: hypothetical protein GM45_5095 [actinobacterium acAMD-5]
MSRTPVTWLVWHLLVIATGVLFMLAGLAMLVVPGPGVLFIILSLLVLSSEYAWARRALGPIKRIIEVVSAWWSDPLLRKIRRQVLILFGLLVIAGVSWYLVKYGTSLDGFRNLEELLTR